MQLPGFFQILVSRDASLAEATSAKRPLCRRCKAGSEADDSERIQEASERLGDRYIRSVANDRQVLTVVEAE